MAHMQGSQELFAGNLILDEEKLNHSPHRSRDFLQVESLARALKSDYL